MLRSNDTHDELAYVSRLRPDSEAICSYKEWHHMRIWLQVPCNPHPHLGARWYLLIGVTRCLQSEDIRIMALFRAPPPRLTIARPSESPGVLLGAGGERKFVCLRTEDEDISDQEIPKMGRNVRRGTRQVHLLLSRRPWNLAYVEI